MRLGRLLRNLLRGLRSSTHPIPLPENEPNFIVEQNQPAPSYEEEPKGAVIQPPDER